MWLMILLLSVVAPSVKHHYYYLTCAAASMLNDSGENVAPRVMTMVQRRKRGGAIAMRTTCLVKRRYQSFLPPGVLFILSVEQLITTNR